MVRTSNFFSLLGIENLEIVESANTNIFSFYFFNELCWFYFSWAHNHLDIWLQQSLKFQPLQFYVQCPLKFKKDFQLQYRNRITFAATFTLTLFRVWIPMNVFMQKCQRKVTHLRDLPLVFFCILPLWQKQFNFSSLEMK